jgi:hypothetical protein
VTNQKSTSTKSMRYPGKRETWASVLWLPALSS